jgi:16S rRNA (guanine527-N7)-methyltransferase
VNLSLSAGEKLAGGLRELGFDGGEALAARLLSFGSAVMEANRSTNLVGAKSIENLVAAHLLDSLSIVPLVPLRSPVFDVGSGAGLPGIPLAIAAPKTTFVLFEPRRKRADFLGRIVNEMGVGNASVEQMTAETAGRGAWRNKGETVLVRAVARPRTALELGLPLVAADGQLVLFTGREAEPDEATLSVAALLGGRLAQARAVHVPYLEGSRHLWTFTRAGVTPPEYPRRSGIPSKQPLEPA